MNKEIVSKFKQVTELLNMPNEGERTKSKNAKNYYKKRFLTLDYAPIYGGYVLMIVNKNTGQSFLDSYTRRPKKEFIAYLDGLLLGLDKTKLNIKL